MAIVGGAKVTDKIGVLEAFLQRADAILIGGAMAFPFLSVQGHSIGDSLCADEDLEPGARAARARQRTSCACPSTSSSAEAFDADTERRELDGVDVPDGWMGLDVGPRTADGLRRGDRRRRHGVLERPDGRLRARAVRGRHARGRGGRGGRAGHDRRRRRRLVGGPARSSAWPIDVTHLSTGGGASLELIEGKTLPGVEVLS